MIIETIVSTKDNDGKVNFSPFGIKKNKNQIYISPYIPSRTLLNLESTKCAVVNYTDSTSFFVDCIIGNKEFKKKKCKNFPGFFLENCLQVLSLAKHLLKKLLFDYFLILKELL